MDVRHKEVSVLVCTLPGVNHTDAKELQIIKHYYKTPHTPLQPSRTGDSQINNIQLWPKMCSFCFGEYYDVTVQLTFDIFC